MGQKCALVYLAHLREVGWSFKINRLTSSYPRMVVSSIASVVKWAVLSPALQTDNVTRPPSRQTLALELLTENNHLFRLGVVVLDRNSRASIFACVILGMIGEECQVSRLALKVQYVGFH